MSISGRATATVRRLAAAAGIGMFVFAVMLIAVGFLIDGFYVWIGQYEPHANAAAITGGVLLVVAIVIGLIGSLVLKKMKKQQPSLLAEFGGIAGTAGRIAGLLIRRDPRKSLILAVIAGAVAEYVTSEGKKRN